MFTTRDHRIPPAGMTATEPSAEPTPAPHGPSSAFEPARSLAEEGVSRARPGASKGFLSALTGRATDAATATLAAACGRASLEESSPIKAKTPLQQSILDAVHSSAMRGSVRPALAVTQGNRLISADVGGDAVFARQAELVKAAKKEVLIQTFAWDPHSAGARMILDALAMLADERRDGAERLTVRLMVDEGTGLAKKFMLMTSANKNTKSGRWPSRPEALVGNYQNNPEHKYANIVKDFDFQVRVYQHSSSNSLHSKSLVVDGVAAAITGANVQSRNHGEMPAYDLGVTMSGSVASGLRDDFVSHWNAAVNPDQETQAMVLTPPSSAPSPDGPSDGVVMALLTRRPNWNVFHNGVTSPQNRGFMAAMRNAKKSIQVMTPNLNAPAVRDALVHAANRNVNVQILVSKGFNDERVKGFIAGGTNDEAIRDILRRVHDKNHLDIRYFQNPNHPETEPVPEGNAAGNGASHAKFMAVDGEVAIVGSSNMDKTSWHFSAETNVAILDTEATEAISGAIFAPAWTRSQPVK